MINKLCLPTPKRMQSPFFAVLGSNSEERSGITLLSKSSQQSIQLNGLGEEGDLLSEKETLSASRPNSTHSSIDGGVSDIEALKRRFAAVKLGTL